MGSININQPVDITKLGFRKNLETYPCRMEYNGGSYNFIDAGLRCVIKRGSTIYQILMMTDGQAQYRLQSDTSGGNWTLLSITADTAK